jgi:glutathione S-transferase
VANSRHWVLTGKAARRPPALVESKREGGLKALAILDRALAARPFVAGSAYTIADMSVFAYGHLAGDAGLPIDDYRHVCAWIDRVRSQAGFLAEMFPYSIDPHSGRELP